MTADVLDDGEYWVHELVGARVVSADGRALGTVTAVEANPAHDQLVLDGGALVPMVFVTEHRDGHVVVDVPEGLFDL
jgi:16S rRNA processing protein RimM